MSESWQANHGLRSGLFLFFFFFAQGCLFKSIVCFCNQAITKIMLHPENSALVITAAMDGIVKVNSLDFMEEIYR